MHRRVWDRGCSHTYKMEARVTLVAASCCAVVNKWTYVCDKTILIREYIVIYNTNAYNVVYNMRAGYLYKREARATLVAASCCAVVNKWTFLCGKTLLLREYIIIYI